MMMEKKKRNPNLCETAQEYPSLNVSSLPRHLCTCTKSWEPSETVSPAKTTTTEHSDGKQPKTQRAETDCIQVILYATDRTCRHEHPAGDHDNAEENA